MNVYDRGAKLARPGQLAGGGAVLRLTYTDAGKIVQESVGLANTTVPVKFFTGCFAALSAVTVKLIGIALVPEGRRLFSSLSVEENLLVGAYGRRDGGPWNLAAVYRLFPVLLERRHSPSTTLSGGQQQMVAIGRSLMSNPRILLCDEISLGLAPIVIRDIYAALADIKTRGTSVVLVEQDLMHAMSVADRAYCFQEGRVSLSGRPAELTRDEIHAAYFGI